MPGASGLPPRPLSSVPTPVAGSGLHRLVVVIAAALGVLYGYDTGVVAGALLFVPKALKLSTSDTSSIATAVVLGMIAGALIASRLADAIGRKRTMIIVTAGYVVFAALSAVAANIVWLDGARFFLGVAIGLALVTAPVYIAESSSADRRGRMLVAYQVATVVGIMLAYLLDYALAPAGLWRWMFGLSAIPAVGVGLLLLRLPDTPRWYLMKGRREEALRTLERIDPTENLAHIEAAMQAQRGGNLREMIHRPYLRATVFVVTLGFLIQISGINAIVYFTPLIFAKMGLHGYGAELLVPAGVQAAALGATLLSLHYVDRLGRRPVLFIGIVAMIAANVLMIVVFAAGLGSGLSSLAFVGILLFTCGFDFGFGALVWVYASESFPGGLRTAGASAMLTADLVGNLIIAQYFLSVLGKIGGVATFSIFLGLAALSLGFVWKFAPETKGRPLDAIPAFWRNGGRWDTPPVAVTEPPATGRAA